MVKDHSNSERDETRCRHMGCSFRLAARVLLYAPSHRQDSTYHGLCYTSRGALAGMGNSSMKDRSDDPSHHERTVLPRRYISLLVTGIELRITHKTCTYTHIPALTKHTHTHTHTHTRTHTLHPSIHTHQPSTIPHMPNAI